MAIGGCSASSDSKSSNRTSGGVAPANDAGAKGEPAAAPTAAGAGGQVAGPDQVTLPANAVQRSIVYSGSITVRVKDVAASSAQAEALAIGSGGYVGSDDRTLASGQSVASLVLRVPAKQFDSTVNSLGALGTEQDRKISTEDVTQQVIDVGARLKTQQASVDRVRALLAKATSIADIVSIEGELTRREADLESLEAQQQSLADLSSLSTIAVTLLGPDAPAPVHKKADTGFVAGFKSGWHTFVSSVTVLVTIIGALLPFAVVIGVPLLVWLTVRRRRQRRLGPAAMPPAPATVMPAPVPAMAGAPSAGRPGGQPGAVPPHETSTGADPAAGPRPPA
jgi:hypothetical protein